MTQFFVVVGPSGKDFLVSAEESDWVGDYHSWIGFAERFEDVKSARAAATVGETVVRVQLTGSSTSLTDGQFTTTFYSTEETV